MGYSRRWIFPMVRYPTSSSYGTREGRNPTFLKYRRRCFEGRMNFLAETWWIRYLTARSRREPENGPPRAALNWACPHSASPWQRWIEACPPSNWYVKRHLPLNRTV